ncbi:MAG: hypothetical protein ACK4RK_00375 [Gemmataceae bacterium]
MPIVLEDRYVVYARRPMATNFQKGVREDEMASYATYAEARRCQLRWLRSGVNCVIRFVGVTGSGD